jgi:hypothetical protein
VGVLGKHKLESCASEADVNLADILLHRGRIEARRIPDPVVVQFECGTRILRVIHPGPPRQTASLNHRIPLDVDRQPLTVSIPSIKLFDLRPNAANHSSS